MSDEPTVSFPTEMPTEPVAVLAPRADLARAVKSLSPENLKKTAAQYPTNSDTRWGIFTERLGLCEAVEEIDIPRDPGLALAIAVLELPDEERHELSGQYPMEVLACASLAWSDVTGQNPTAVQEILSEFYAPNVVKALYWSRDNTPKNFARAFGLTKTMH